MKIYWYFDVRFKTVQRALKYLILVSMTGEWSPWGWWLEMGNIFYALSNLSINKKYLYGLDMRVTSWRSVECDLIEQVSASEQQDWMDCQTGHFPQRVNQGLYRMFCFRNRRSQAASQIWLAEWQENNVSWWSDRFWQIWHREELVREI